MELTLTLDNESADELRSMRTWLLAEDEMRGRVRMLEVPPAPDRLGPLLEALQVTAGPVAAAFSASVVAWLRSRVGNVRLVITTKEGEKFDFRSKNVHGMDASSLAELTDQLARFARNGTEDQPIDRQGDTTTDHSNDQRDPDTETPDS